MLTAAHCLSDKRYLLPVIRAGKLEIRADEPKTQASRAHRVVFHPRYTEGNMGMGPMHDLCLVKLRRGFRFHKRVQAVRMPFGFQPFRVGSSAQVVGWGATGLATFSPQLMKANVILRRCKPELERYEICAKGKDGEDACMGDSGGPLLCEGDILCGVVSWGPECDIRARGAPPGHFAKVSVEYWFLRNYLTRE